MITSGREMYTKHYLPLFAKALSSCTQSFIHVSIMIMIVWILIVPLFPHNASAQSANKVVKVVGFGSTPNEARNDAIRQALQETMQQLIVVDRAIKDDQIIRDKIMSTMNGYIENFKELSIKKEGQQIEVQAEITVSPSRIENFIGTSIGGGGSVSGAGLFAESQREIAQRKARGEIFDRLFRGFPSEVIDVKLEKVQPNEKNPLMYDFYVTLSFSKSWINAINTGIKELQRITHSYPTVCRYSGAPDQNCIEWRNSNLIRVGNELGGKLDRQVKPNEFVICFREGNELKCSILSPGTYGSQIKKSLFGDGKYVGYDVGRGENGEGLIVFATQIVDERGASVITEKFKNKFLAVTGMVQKKESVGNFIATTFETKEQKANWLFDLNPVKIRLSMRSENFKVSDAKHIVLLPILLFCDTIRSPQQESLIMDVLSSGKNRSEIYGDPMTKAIQRVMMQ